MDPVTREAILLSLQESRQFSEGQLRAAKQVLEGSDDDATVSEGLQQLGLLTHYQARKIRIGRFSELAFGPYFILEKLGEGGMGKVYKAIQRSNGRVVALKVVRPHLMSNRTVLKRYQREAAAVARLAHENIVILYDIDDVNGRYYLAMEYVDGIDLSRMVKEFGQPPQRGLPTYQEACEYIRQAALGLAHAHERGLVHRDIKPSNILVHGERALPGTNGKARIKVLDMGLVRSLSDDDDASRTELTRDGTVVGTPDYMAPEQAKNSSTVDGRADVYSLGCTLFFLLCGRSLFPDGSPIEKLLKHQVDPPPELGRLRPDVPPALVKVWLRMVEKDRTKRYSSATEVAAALYPFTPTGQLESGTLDHQPFSLEPDSPASDEFDFAPETSSDEIMDAEAVSPPPLPAAQTAPTVPTRPKVRRKSPPPAQRPAKVVPAQPAPSVPGAMALPRPDAAPSSESLPSTPAAAAPKTTRTVRAGEDTPPQTERRRDRRPVKPRPSPFMMPLIIGGVFAAVLLLIVAGWLIFGGNNPVAPTTRAAEPTSVTPPTAAPAAPTPELASDLSDLLPDRTQAVVVLRPEKYLSRLAYSRDLGVSPKAIKFIKLLDQKMRLDPRVCARVTIPFVGPQNQWAVIGEGAFLTPDWEQGFVGMPGMQRQTDTREKVFHSLAWPTGPSFGLILNQMAYMISSELRMLEGLADRQRRNAPKTGLSPEVLEGLKVGTTNPAPDLLFLAGSSYHLPLRTQDGPTLNDQGVRWARVSVNLVGDGFEFWVTVSGANKTKLKAFLNEYLVTVISERYPQVEGLIEKILQGEPSEEGFGQDFKLHLRGRINWALFHELVDKTLPEPELVKE